MRLFSLSVVTICQRLHQKHRYPHAYSHPGPRKKGRQFAPVQGGGKRRGEGGGKRARRTEGIRAMITPELLEKLRAKGWPKNTARYRQ